MENKCGDDGKMKENFKKIHYKHTINKKDNAITHR